MNDTANENEKSIENIVSYVILGIFGLLFLIIFLNVILLPVS